MKILQIGKFYPIRGGVEKVMLDLTQGLSARGFDVDMMAASADGREGTERLSDHGRVIVTRTVTKAKSTMISPDMATTLRRVADDYDLIHIHHPDPMAALALRLSGYQGPVVLHWHADILRQRMLLQAYRPLQHWIRGRADLIVTTSPHYLEGSPWLQSFRTKTAVLPIGVDAVNADGDAVGRLRALAKGRRTVFSVGRLVPYKGFDVLIRAARELPDDYLVVIAGEGELRPELETLIAELGLADKVWLTGRISDAERDAWMFAADVFCLPSVERTEAFGIVLIEAMSAGLPLVATEIPGSGTWWVNAHGDSGLNVPIHDHSAMARAILDITSDPQTHAAFRRHARRRWEEVFTSAGMIDNCLSLYRRLIDIPNT